MGAFDADFAVADELFAEAFGDTVSLHRGVATATGIVAEAVQRDYEIFDVDGFETTANLRDYVIDVADYTISGSAVTPQIGDRIKETISGVVHVFEVVPLGRKPCYEWAGTRKPQWLVHTKLAGVE